MAELLADVIESNHESWAAMTRKRKPQPDHGIAAACPL